MTFFLFSSKKIKKQILYFKAFILAIIFKSIFFWLLGIQIIFPSHGQTNKKEFFSLMIVLFCQIRSKWTQKLIMCQKYIFKKAYYNLKVLMQQLDEFCRNYLPSYFLLKYKEGNIKPQFFYFKNQGNVYEVTGKIFRLVDQLFSANPSLQPTKLIDKYFSFRLSDFDSKCKDLISEDEDSVVRAIRKMLKKMEDYHRLAFQIMIQLTYLYFDCKEFDDERDIKKTQNRKEYRQLIPTNYMHLKGLTMLQTDQFSATGFMQYSISLLLDIKPNLKFIKLIRVFVQQCSFNETVVQNILNKIEKVEQQQIIREIAHIQRKKSAKKQTLQSQKYSMTQIQTKIDSNEGTPVKEKSVQKTEQKTFETSQKKQHIIFKFENQNTNSLQILKKSLNLQRSSKQRTLYNCKKYVVHRKTQFKQTNIVKSDLKINKVQQLKFSDLNRSYSTRCLDASFFEDGDFLAGATPKPKKKIKTQKVPEQSKMFDENGNFIRKK